MAEDWSTLPFDLLAVILMKLENWRDFLYFSVVCQWWNYVSVLIEDEWRPTTGPWLLLAENIEENSSQFRKMFNLINNKCYNFRLPETFGARCFGSDYGWVALIDRGFNVQLFNPVTKARILFPSLETMIPYIDPSFDKNNEEDIIWFLTAIIWKLVVLKVPRGDHYEFVITAFNGHCLFYARHGDQSWTLVLREEGRMLNLVDVIGMNDHVYAMYYDGAIIYWNVTEFYGLEGVKPMDYCPGKPYFITLNRGCEKMYLVQSGTDLLMVLRDKEHGTSKCIKLDTFYRTLGFKVYRLHIKDKRWEEIDELGDVALFVGNNSSMSVSGPLSQGLQRSIYFTDDEFQFWCMPKDLGGFGGYDMGVYDLKCGKILQFYEGDDTLSFFSPSTWFIF